jgi:hypothetical protein
MRFKYVHLRARSHMASQSASPPARYTPGYPSSLRALRGQDALALVRLRELDDRIDSFHIFPMSAVH